MPLQLPAKVRRIAFDAADPVFGFSSNNWLLGYDDEFVVIVLGPAYSRLLARLIAAAAGRNRIMRWRWLCSRLKQLRRCEVCRSLLRTREPVT